MISAHLFAYEDIIGSLLAFLGLLYAIRTESIIRYFVLTIVAIIWINPVLFKNYIVVLSNIFLQFMFIPLFLFSLLIIFFAEKENRLFCIPIIFLVFLVFSQATWLYEYNTELRVSAVFMILLGIYFKLVKIIKQ